MLNFDPYRWIAEHDPAEPARSVASVATVARAQPQSAKLNLAERVATVATSATRANQRPPGTVLHEWYRHLSAIDDCRPPAGFSTMWWQQICYDAFWIYENFASRAVRDGWSAHDLFGVLPLHPGSGGLCDRLNGARNLKMAGPKAIWSSWGVPDWTCIGAGDQLISSGLLLIWELKR